MTTTSDTTMDEYVLMAEYDLHVIADQDDYLLFIAGLYRRAGVLKDGYPEELFDDDKEFKKNKDNTLK